MIYNAKSDVLKIDDIEMEYVAFGSGKRQLIMIPGLGDGLRTVKGKELPLAFMYRRYARDYRVYVLSRRRNMPKGFHTRDMARDVKVAMDALGLSEAYVVGVSQGGMIAQYLAIDYPEDVKKLVLAVTTSKPNETLCKNIEVWKELAHRGDYKSIMADTDEKSYTEKYLKKMRAMRAVLGNLSKPQGFERFLVMADACVTHDAHSELHKITCPTLVIGGRKDRIASGRASEEVAECIPGSRIYMYEEYGHGVYEEASDFLTHITDFLETEE